MKYCLICIALAASFTSCNETAKTSDAEQRDTIAADTNIMRIQIPETSCYRHVRAKDTVTLKVEKFPNVVTGSLVYALHEKDRNEGTLDGVFSGDTLIANYTFLSEGTTSMRQVVFLIENDIATEGYGEMKAEKEKMIFKNISETDFTKGLKLQKVSCIE